jgi:hypothetical protein
VHTTISFSWSDESHTLLLIKLQEGWTIAGYATFFDEMSAEIETSAQDVEVIIELENIPSILKGSIVSHLQQLTRAIPDNVRTIVIVTHNPFIRTVNTILFQIMPKARETGALASSVEEARAIIAERRARRHNSQEG